VPQTLFKLSWKYKNDESETVKSKKMNPRMQSGWFWRSVVRWICRRVKESTEGMNGHSGNNEDDEVMCAK